MPHFKRIIGGWAPVLKLRYSIKASEESWKPSNFKRTAADRQTKFTQPSSLLPFLSGCVPCVYLAVLSLHYFDVASSAGECMNTA